MAPRAVKICNWSSLWTAHEIWLHHSRTRTLTSHLECRLVDPRGGRILAQRLSDRSARKGLCMLRKDVAHNEGWHKANSRLSLESRRTSRNECCVYNFYSCSPPRQRVSLYQQHFFAPGGVNVSGSVLSNELHSQRTVAVQYEVRPIRYVSGIKVSISKFLTRILSYNKATLAIGPLR